MKEYTDKDFLAMDENIRRAHIRLDGFIKEREAAVGRDTDSNVGNYKNPFSEAIKNAKDFASKIAEPIKKAPTDLEIAIDVLAKYLKEDPEYFSLWKKNMAIAFKEAWASDIGLSLAIKAQDGAEKFLRQFFISRHLQGFTFPNPKYVPGYIHSYDQAKSIILEHLKQPIKYSILKNGIAISIQKEIKEKCPLIFQDNLLQITHSAAARIIEDLKDDWSRTEFLKPFFDKNISADRSCLVGMDFSSEPAKMVESVVLPSGAKVSPHTIGTYVSERPKLKVGQIYREKNDLVNYEIRGFSKDRVILRVQRKEADPFYIERSIENYKDSIKQGIYILSTPPPFPEAEKPMEIKPGDCFQGISFGLQISPTGTILKVYKDEVPPPSFMISYELIRQWVKDGILKKVDALSL